MSESTRGSLPATHRVLTVQDVNVSPMIEHVALPKTLPGTALLRVISTPIISYTKDIFLGNARKYTFPLPIVPGTSAIGRIVDLPPEATSLQVGQLVFFDCFIRARDTQTGPVQFLSAVHDGYTPASKKLMADGPFRDGSHADYMRAPLENVFALQESRLLSPKPESGLALQLDDLCEIAKLVIPFGGIRSVDLQPGETILISPATGPFGSAACMVALAMGARVIAWGRSESKLQALKSHLSSVSSGRYVDMITTAVLHNDLEKDRQSIQTALAGSPLDVFFDISPPFAQGTTHLKSGILSLRHSGRVSLMGGFREDIGIPHNFVMHFDITLKGKWMYDREDVIKLIRLVETGVLKLGVDGGCRVTGRFELDRWREAWDLAAETTGVGESVVVAP